MDQDNTELFSGMPKREAVTEAAPEVVRPAINRRVAIVAGSVVAVVCGVAIALPIILSNAPTAQIPAPELSLSPEEVAAAEEAIAEGGGAIPGHIVSGELCTAIDAYMAAGSDDEAIVQTTPELLAALNGLAAVESPNQKIFQEYASMMNDPAGLTDLDAKQSLVTDFSDAVQVDVTTCL